MSKYGLIGEIGSGVIGGLGSTWNTPIETLRVLKQKDIAQGIEPAVLVFEYPCDSVDYPPELPLIQPSSR